MIPGFTVWFSNKNIFIEPGNHSTIYSARLFDMTGRLVFARNNLVGSQYLSVPEDQGMLIMRLFTDSGMSIGPYKMLNTPDR